MKHHLYFAAALSLLVMSQGCFIQDNCWTAETSASATLTLQDGSSQDYRFDGDAYYTDAEDHSEGSPLELSDNTRLTLDRWSRGQLSGYHLPGCNGEKVEALVLELGDDIGKKRSVAITGARLTVCSFKGGTLDLAPPRWQASGTLEVQQVEDLGENQRGEDVERSKGRFDLTLTDSLTGETVRLTNGAYQVKVTHSRCMPGVTM